MERSDISQKLCEAARQKRMHTSYIGIGSNLGSREDNCLTAIRLLSDRGIIVRRKSSMHETEPWGVKDQPRFINMVAEVETELDPKKLLEILKKVEEEIGRREGFRWGPRQIDLDILFYDNTVLKESALQIPHPHLHEREFVLTPLAEIAPDKVHPVLKKTIKKLLSELE